MSSVRWIHVACGVVSVLATAELARLHGMWHWPGTAGQPVSVVAAAPPRAGPSRPAAPAAGQASLPPRPLADGVVRPTTERLRGQGASADIRLLYQRVAASGDNHGLPFMMVDKRAARLFIFDATGALVDQGPVLLGLARGDQSYPGIGERPLNQVRPFERTTPAGRFMAQHGVNAAGEDVVWVDYAAAVSLHRVRATVAAERRLQRLASRSAADNRISFGCINLPPALYEHAVLPLFGASRGVVYVLPETQPVATFFAPLLAAGAPA